MSTQKDNSTLRNKVSLRLDALAACQLEHPHPVVLETHGGNGVIYARCYVNARTGAVFETNERKADRLAKHRPTWAVYASDCAAALAAGACDHLSVDLLDLDPYGSPFPAMAGFFQSTRPFPPRMQLVVNDGLRQKVAIGAAWHCHDLRDIVADWGNDLHHRYLDVAKEKVRRIVKSAGYELVAWKGYYTGKHKAMTHYWASLSRRTEAKSAA